MKHNFVFYSIGKLLQILAAVLCIPTGIAVFDLLRGPVPWHSGLLLDSSLIGFICAIIASFLCGTVLILLTAKRKGEGGVREGFAIVTFGWLALTLFGCIPLFVYFLFLESNGFPPLPLLVTDAFFEIMSGFTTTGATILTNIESLPRSLLFWRSMTHWLGGMGIVTLALAIFPAFGVTAYQMFRGEVPGPSTERLRPHLAQTATILWGVYVVLTLLETLFLTLAGMSLFDALCHAFGTMATGGFSTKNASIAAYNSPVIEWIIILFMFAAGMNFIIHYRMLFFRDFSLLKTNREFQFYSLVIGGVLICVALILVFQGLASDVQIHNSYRVDALNAVELRRLTEEQSALLRNPLSTIRHAAFQVISLVTTTGYVTADFDVWPNVVRYMLVVVMFFGGCAGSTGGGIKMIRIMVVLKSAWREVRSMIQPRLILPIKIGRKMIEEKQVANIQGFFMLFLVLFVFFTLLMSFFIPDFTTALTSVVATMCNIGPGLSGVGATENYAWIPVAGKWVLILCMLLGRLEIYTVLIAFAPLSWKK